MTDDITLVARSRDGDVAAYGELVRRYEDDARRVAMAIAGFEHADDAAQDAFVRAYRSLASYDPARPFRPWLLAIVANAARNQRRAAARWHASLLRSLVAAPVAVDIAAEDHVLDKESHRRLRAALETLPRRQRDVVACRYLLDLSEDETALSLGIARGTVKSRLSRALDRLEQALSAEVCHD
jgi:RNA polymerase sigma factor (sigma-70 family)